MGVLQEELRSTLGVSFPMAAQPAPAMLGCTPAFERVRHLIERLAPSSHSILVSGPTGSGKEVVAHHLHLRSERSAAPFIDVNCSAIPENLIESELFGHVKGAYTGAVSDRSGYFAQVGDGTLFLDEIGELPLSLQARLLRVLETRTYRPVGGSKVMHFTGRVVVATHRNLPAMVADGRFREDLFYRLAVFTIELPGLAQRREDIPALVAHFSARQGRLLTFTPPAMNFLCQQAWPGNIRQLRNIIDQLGVLAESSTIDVTALEPLLRPTRLPVDNLDDLADALLRLEGSDKLSAAQYLLIDRALHLSGGNRTAAAQLLGVSRKAVERRLKIRDESGRDAEELLAQARKLVETGKFEHAITLLSRCIDQTMSCADATRLRFDAYCLMEVSLRSVNGWLCARARACSEAALQLGMTCCEPPELAALQFGVWSTQLMALDLGAARATAQNMVERAQSSGHRAAFEEAHTALANTLFWLGDSEEVLACLSRAQLLGATRSDQHIGAQGFDLASLAFTFEGLAAFRLGYFDRARLAYEALSERAVMEHHHPFNQAMVLQGATWLACLFEDMERLGMLAAELERVARQNGFSFYLGVGQVFRGRYQGYLGLYDEGDQAMVQGYEEHMLNHGGRLFHSFQAWQRGETLLQAQQPQLCIVMAEQALECALEQQDRAYLGELQIIKGRALWALGDHESAEQVLRGALNMAQALGSVAASLTAGFYLAKLLAESERPQQAIDMLVRLLRNKTRDDSTALLQRPFSFLDELTFAHKP